MRDISGKQITLRQARAQSVLLCSHETLMLIKAGNLPKGDPFGIVKAAALLASKQTHVLIPHCHPVSIEGMDVQFEIFEHDPHPSGLSSSETYCGIKIETFGKSIGRTGIEMEVLTASSIAALTLYDLLKPVDKTIEIVSTKLLEKSGGKSDQLLFAKGKHQAAILVCSDSTAAGKREDKSGKLIQEMLGIYGVEIMDYKILPDTPPEIQAQIKVWVSEHIPFIFTTGGTGLGPRDQTVEAVKAIIERDAPGITEAMRVYGMQRTPLAMISRSIAGCIGTSLVITLPGSTNGVRESLEAILPGVFHAKKMLYGGGH